MLAVHLFSHFYVTIALLILKYTCSGVSGAFHIGLDMYQSSNGHDFLGIVIFIPAVKDNMMQMERFVLECLRYAIWVLLSRNLFSK
jgi:hypothetical protein